MSAFPISAMTVEQLGWVLLHSLWQFALIAVLAGVTVRLLRRSSSAARYGVLGVAIIATASVPVATWILLPAASPVSPLSRPDFEIEQPTLAASIPAADALRLNTEPIIATETAGEDPFIDVARPVVSLESLPAIPLAAPTETQVELSWSERATGLLRPWLSWIVAGWCVGVVLCALRPLLGWHTLRRLRRVGVSPVSDEMVATLQRMSERLRLRRAVRVMSSTLAQVPIVVGYVRPIILLPVSFMTSIPTAQLESILAHELAHVRRHDFLVNLLQTLVETVFFYHPAVWWLSRRMRTEREHCCDDLVVETLGNRVEYGRALLAIEELRGSSSVLAIGAADGSLLARVRRIVAFPPDRARTSPWPALSLVVCGIFLVCAMSVPGWHRQAEADPPPLEQSPVAELPDGVREADVNLSGEPETRSEAKRDVGASESIVGEVVDAVTGKPVSGATVRFKFRKTRDERGEPVAELVFRNVGQFTFQWPDAINMGTDLYVERTAEHPDYQSPRPVGQVLKFLLHREPNSWRDFIRKVELSPGAVVTGFVRDLNGRPAKGITVVAQRDHHGWSTGYKQKTTTDANGRYRLVVPTDQGRGRLYVTPNHAAGVARAITTDFGEQQVFQLRRGTRLFGRVTDAQGRGVANVVIRADGTDRVPWRYTRTDADGRYSLAPCQYGQYVIELLNEGSIPDLPGKGVRLPDVFVSQLVKLARNAPIQQQLDFAPTASVRVTARYTTSDDQPVSSRRLFIMGTANEMGWEGYFHEVSNNPGLYELRVPRGLEGRIPVNADNGLLRIVRESKDSTSITSKDVTVFDENGISFRIHRMKPTSVTLRPVFGGKVVNPSASFVFPEFADPKAAKRTGARLAWAHQFTQPDSGGVKFGVHPDLDIVLKVNLPGFKPWQETVRTPEGEDRVIDVALEPDKDGPEANNAERRGEEDARANQQPRVESPEKPAGKLKPGAKAKEITDSALKATISMEMAEVMVGEPTWIRFKVENPTDRKLLLRLKGDHRNRTIDPTSKTVPESFSVEMRNETETLLPQIPARSNRMNGLIRPGFDLPAKGEVTIELFVPHWVTITEPGRYDVKVHCQCELSPHEGRNLIELVAETTLQVTPADTRKFGEVIDRLGRKLVADDSSASDRAHRMLMVIHDERVVVWYVKLLEQSRYTQKFNACTGLGPYGSDTALSALKRAMQVMGRDISNTSTRKGA